MLRQESYVNIKGYVDILLPVKDRLHAHESCTDRNVRHFYFLQHGRVLTGLLISALVHFQVVYLDQLRRTRGAERQG